MWTKMLCNLKYKFNIYIKTGEIIKTYSVLNLKEVRTGDITKVLFQLKSCPVSSLYNTIFVLYYTTWAYNQQFIPIYQPIVLLCQLKFTPIIGVKIEINKLY